MNARLNQLLGMLSAQPDATFLLYAVAIEYKSAGMNLEAAQYFSKTLEIDAQYLAAYYHYGKVLELLDDKVLAAEIYLKGIEVSKHQKDMKTFHEMGLAYENLTGIDYEDL